MVTTAFGHHAELEVDMAQYQMMLPKGSEAEEDEEAEDDQEVEEGEDDDIPGLFEIVE